MGVHSKGANDELPRERGHGQASVTVTPPRVHDLARVSVALFAASTAFPIGASLLAPDHVPRWLGVLDVVVAATLFVATALVVTRARPLIADGHRLTALRVSQSVLAVVPALLAAYFVLGSRLDWTVLTIGLAWRAWLLLVSLPSLVAALQARPAA